MAVLRKIVILDYKKVSPDYVYATAALALAVSVGYYLAKSLHGTQAGTGGQRLQPTNPSAKVAMAQEDAACAACQYRR